MPPRSSYALLVALVLFAVPKTGVAQRNTAVVPAGILEEQLILDSHPPNTHFIAKGLVLKSGKSDRFVPPPTFALLHDPKHDPDSAFGYPKTDILESWEIPNGERYPIQLRDLESPSISGFTVIGTQSKLLPWRVMKAMWDGDALHVKGCSGIAEVADVYFENVEDGFGPNEGLSAWVLKNAYMRSIRDDAIENDDLIPGVIENCLIDGCFVFLSQQPGDRSDRTPLTKIRNCLVHVEPQPHDGVTGRAWRDRYIEIGDDGIGRAPGTLFKWTGGTGAVDVRDCIFRVDAISFNGPREMPFPPGTYKNVTLVWLGRDDYPEPLPEGVRITRDISVWNAGRSRWIEDLAPDHPAAAILK